MLTHFLKFEISILPAVRHKFVCYVILVLSMRTWYFINENLIVYPEQGFQNVSRAAALVNPGGSTQRGQLKYFVLLGNEKDYFLKLLEQALISRN